MSRLSSSFVWKRCRHFALVGLLTAGPLTGCSQPQTGSQTNWLTTCDTDDDCGGLECLCGTCTRACDDTDACVEAGLGSCVSATDRSAVALCDGREAPSGLCLARCDETADDCPSGTICRTGICAPELGSDLELTVDVSDRHRALIGIGASLAYSEDLIAAHPDKQELFDAMFVDSGFEAIRVRNRYETGTEDLSAVAEVVAAATERLGYEPSLLMTSGSPPAALKENGERFCGSTDPACTLGRDAQGDFDYAGFAEYWRASLDAYATAGVVPTFVSIQNHPSWVPTDSTEQEACWFLPTEGTTELVGTDGVPVPAELPGYDAALAAVRASAASVGDYQFVAAETAEWTLTAEYAPALTLGDLGALAFTLYGFDALSVDEGALEGLRNLAALGESSGLPILQTEMRSTGIETAALAHYALAEADSGAYFHLDFVGLAAGDETPVTLIAVDDGAIEPLPNYHALAHFARHTEPGWLRVGTTSDAPSGLLVSAWLAPDQSALTLVLVNPTGESIDVTLNQPELELPIADGQLLRTVFDGSERSAELGSVGSTGRVRVPGRSVVTVALGTN